MLKHVVFRPRIGQVTVILLYQIIFSTVNMVLLGCMLLHGSPARIKSLRLINHLVLGGYSQDQLG